MLWKALFFVFTFYSCPFWCAIVTIWKISFSKFQVIWSQLEFATSAVSIWKFSSFPFQSAKMNIRDNLYRDSIREITKQVSIWLHIQLLVFWYLNLGKWDVNKDINWPISWQYYSQIVAINEAGLITWNLILGSEIQKPVTCDAFLDWWFFREYLRSEPFLHLACIRWKWN